MRGLPKKYAKMGFKKGWRAYRAAHKKTKRSNPRKTTKKVIKVARRYTPKRRRRRPKTIPLLPLIGLGAGVAEPIANIVKDPSAESIKGSLNHMALIYTGYNAIEGQFQPDMLSKGLLPLVAGIVGHKVLTMLGVNRTFANLPSPLNKLRL